ncbi:MAG TPA: hypothetical protein VMW25_04920 [Clostridia bacterium]|nr:hypothetical protein [Clostridia bacterium]
MATLLELEQKERVIINRDSSLAYIPETRPPRLDYKRLLTLMGHGGAAHLVGNLKGLLRAVDNFAKDNSRYEFRTTAFFGESVKLTYLPPFMLPPHNLVYNPHHAAIYQETSLGPPGIVVNAVFDAFEERGVESNEFLVGLVGGTGRDIVPWIKVTDKLRTAFRGTMLWAMADTDGIMALPEGIPRELIGFHQLAEIVNQKLTTVCPELSLAEKQSSWRKSATMLNILGANNQILGHFYHPCENGFYLKGPHEDIMESLMAADCDPLVILHRRPDFLIDGVFVDIQWQHRPMIRIRYQEGNRPRAVRVTTDHWPYLGLRNKSETFFRFSRKPRTYASCNLIPIQDCDPRYPVNWERIRASLDTAETQRQLVDLARKTAEDVRRVIFAPIASSKNLEGIIREVELESDRMLSSEEVVAKLVAFQLETIKDPINVAPVMGIRMKILSPEDNQGPIFGTGEYQLFFTDGYRGLRPYFGELVAEAGSWTWKDGKSWQRLIRYAAKKAKSLEELYNWFTPFYAKDSLLAKKLVKETLDSALNS